MEMCYEGALVMPSSYAVMNEEEMTYVEGGGKITINRTTIKRAFNQVIGYVGTACALATIAQCVIKVAPTIAKIVLGAGPLAQAAAVILADVIVASAIAVATVYACNASITLGF